MRLFQIHIIMMVAISTDAVTLVHLEKALNTTDRIYLYLRTKDEMYRADAKCMYLEPNRPNEGYQYFLERGYKVNKQWRKANITATLAGPERIGDPPTITLTRPHDTAELITYTMIYWDEDGKCFILLYTREVHGNRKSKCEMYQWNEKVDERRGPIFSHTPVNRETVLRPCEQEYYDYCKDPKPVIVYDMIECKGTNPPLPK
uniref:Lipocalin/cytosolic fatty-acid binding domain-containing protein n=1 Tax=Amblyomma maculatum TaxID=34609 RepID=G3MKE3_AMBMU